jgi:hypothetical protein
MGFHPPDPADLVGSEWPYRHEREHHPGAEELNEVASPHGITSPVR